MQIVHEGRGGYIEIDGRRYVIEHVSGGRFAIHYPSGHRRATRAGDFELLSELVASAPSTWGIEDSSRR